MKVVIFTYKSLKELLGKPSEDATRKWVDSRGLQRRNRENSNVKEVLVPYEMYQKLWESAGRPQEFSNLPSEDLPEEAGSFSVDDGNIVNAEFTTCSSSDSGEEPARNPYALSTDFAEDFIRELAARQDALIDKNDALYDRVLELTRYQERAELLENELKKKEDLIEKYNLQMQELNYQLREFDAAKVKIELVKELAGLKDQELAHLRDKIDKLNILNNELQKELESERKRPGWIKRIIGN